MKIKTHLLQEFDDKPGEKPSKVSAIMPIGSRFLSVKILHDGVVSWFAIPEIETEEKEEHQFYLMKPDESIPDGYEFADVVDTIIEVPTREGLRHAALVIPVYYKKP